MRIIIVFIIILLSITRSHAQDKFLDSLSITNSETNKALDSLSLIPKKDSIIVATKDTVSNPSKQDSLQTKTKDTLIQPKDSLSNRAKRKKKLIQQMMKDTLSEMPEFTYDKYKFISYERDTTYLDTSLTIDKYYKYNYLRDDMVGMLPYANPGQPYTQLERSFKQGSSFFNFGAIAKHFDYQEKEQTRYYSTASPTTEIFYKSSINQGQMADAWISLNTSKQFNISWGYKAIRSLGNYKNSLANHSRTQITMNYHTKNKRWQSRFHFVDQTFNNKENGGLKDENEFEEEGKDVFSDRRKINVNHTDASSELYGRRYFFDNQFYIVPRYIPTDIKMSIGHEYMLHIKYYRYSQDSPNVLYGEAFGASKVSDIADYRIQENKIYSTISQPLLGDFRFEATHRDFKYFFQRLYYAKDGLIPNILDSSQWSLSGYWQRKLYKKFTLKLSADSAITGDYKGEIVRARLNYDFREDIGIGISASHSLRYPNMNKLLHQSEYRAYNWVNTSNFSRELVDRVEGRLKYKKWIDMTASYNLLTNHTYFMKKEEDSQSTGDTESKEEQLVLLKPLQYKPQIGFFKVKLRNEIRLWKFALDNTILYQAVTQDSQQLLNVPTLRTRNSLYYFSDVFKKAMYVEIGLTFNYFSKYFSDAYNPVLGDYYVQHSKQIGGYPVIDAFLTGRVRQTRLFLIFEHINSGSSDFFYSAPRYPHRDFAFRFGIVWNFFM